MRVLIIGGSGLIGRAAAATLLEAGDEVSVASRGQPQAPMPGVSWCPLDICDARAVHALVQRTRPHAVLHLAALLQFDCEREPTRAVRVNIDGTLNVMEASCKYSVRRVVFGSSVAVYGPTSETLREEAWTFGDVGLYGVTKLMGEALGRRYRAEHGLQFIALRYSGVFGRQDPGCTAPSSGMSLARKRILECAKGSDVPVDGADGTEHTHLTHVVDAAEATRLALHHPAPAHEIYNVAGPTGNHMTLRELHEAVRMLRPSAGSALWQGKGRTVGLVDTARIREDLGYRPRITVLAGLAEALGLSDC